MKTHKFVLFLDIDGVLNSTLDPTPNNPDDDFNLDMIGRLNRIMHDCPNIQIILISDWLFGTTWDQVRDHMVRNGFLFGDRVIGQISKTFGSRIHQITNWLDDNLTDDFIILDDVDPGFPTDMKSFDSIKKNHWFQPNEKIGLTDDMTTLIINRCKPGDS